MTNRQRGYGLTAELENKKAAKFDPDLANELFEWMALCLPNERGQLKTVEKIQDVTDALKNGVILCKLVNVIKPNSVKKINTNKQAFKEMENISNFLTACESFGCRKTDLFQTVDLYEAGNIPQVINGIQSLGRKAQLIQGFGGPYFGPLESTANKREFTEQQLRAGQGFIGLQAGSNKGASQAGQNFGKNRQILD